MIGPLGPALSGFCAFANIPGVARSLLHNPANRSTNGLLRLTMKSWDDIARTNWEGGVRVLLVEFKLLPPWPHILLFFFSHALVSSSNGTAWSLRFAVDSNTFHKFVCSLPSLDFRSAKKHMNNPVTLWSWKKIKGQDSRSQKTSRHSHKASSHFSM